MAKIFHPTVRIDKAARYVHVETELGIVNIYYGMTDYAGHKVEAVAMLPSNYPGELPVIIQEGRFVQMDGPVITPV